MGEEVTGWGVPGWLPADLAAAVPSGGRAFFVACQPCLWFALSPPSPRPPSPQGKGEIFCFLMQGASPLASPGLSRKRHWDRGGRTTRPAGGWLFQSPANLTAVVPGGMVRFLCRRHALPLAYLLSPIPPPPFPSGEGGDFLFSYARGFAPCIPGTEPEAALGQGGEPRARRGACLPCCRLTLPLWYPEGGLGLFGRRLFSAVSMLYFPHPPDPLPGGKGEILTLFCRGLRPLHPRG